MVVLSGAMLMPASPFSRTITSGGHFLYLAYIRETRPTLLIAKNAAKPRLIYKIGVICRYSFINRKYSVKLSGVF